MKIICLVIFNLLSPLNASHRTEAVGTSYIVKCSYSPARTGNLYVTRLLKCLLNSGITQENVCQTVICVCDDDVENDPVV